MNPGDSGPPAAATVRVRYFAAARDGAGTAEEELAVPAGAPLAAVLAAAVGAHGGPAGRLAQVLPRCSLLLDGLRADPQVPAPDGAVLDVLPPFAGG